MAHFALLPLWVSTGQAGVRIMWPKGVACSDFLPSLENSLYLLKFIVLWRSLSSHHCQHFENISETTKDNQRQILCRVSLRWGNKSLFRWSWSHDQDGPHDHNVVKTFKNLFLWNWLGDVVETWYTASRTSVLPTLFKMMTLGWPLTFWRKG